MSTYVVLEVAEAPKGPRIATAGPSVLSLRQILRGRLLLVAATATGGERLITAQIEGRCTARRETYVSYPPEQRLLEVVIGGGAGFYLGAPFVLTTASTAPSGAFFGNRFSHWPSSGASGRPDGRSRARSCCFGGS